MNLFFIVVCLCLLGYCPVLTKHGRFSIETTPFFVISMLITLLYIFAYIGFLRVGTLLILSLGFVCLIYSFILLWADKKILFEKYLTPGFVLGILLCIISVLVVKPVVTRWDALAFWGPFIKLMVINHGFIKPDDMIPHTGYPLGGSLFYYPFVWLKFNEASVLKAQQLLLFAPLLVMAQKIPWKKWYSLVSFAIFGYIITYFFIKMILRASLHEWNTLYMDFPTAVFFASTIIYYQMSRKTSFDILRLSPCIFALLLLKPQLLPIAILIVIFVAADQLLTGVLNIRHRITMLKGETIKYQRIVLSRILSIISILIVAFLAFYSWKIHVLAIKGTDILGLSQVTVGDIIKVLTFQTTTTIQKICINCFSHMVRRPLIDSFVFLFFALLISKLQATKKMDLHIVTGHIILFLGSLAYLFGLLLLYLFAFSDIEKTYLASFDRYILIYYFAWLLILYNTFFHWFFKCKHKLMRFSVHVISIALAVFVIISVFYQAHYYTRTQQWQFRQTFETIGNAVKRYVPSTRSSKVFVVWQNTSGLPGEYLRYILIPISINLGDTSMGPPYGDEKYFTNNITPAQFIQKISHYNYLLLAYTDKQFWDIYGQLFTLQPPALTPLVSYEACFGTAAFSPIMQRECTMRAEKAYLFKIVHGNNGKIGLINVKTSNIQN